MQILEIVLYNEDGKKRILPFKVGEVNIITGDSKTGKTSIIDIIDYCFGSSDFKVAEGVVRDYVWWYAVRFQLEHGQILVARPNPTKYDRSASDVYFLQGDEVPIPDFEELKKNLNTEILLNKLARIIGIDEYTHQVETLSRPQTPITFKHSRYYSFQPQTDIDQKDFLFYTQKKEYWIEQSMKDTLPYFLGAIETENISLVRKLATKKRNLNRLLRELKQAEAVVDKTLGQVFDLINEAKQVGLIGVSNIAQNREEGLKLLQSISENDLLEETRNAENQILVELQTQRGVLSKELDSIKQNIRDTENYQKETQGYLSEATYQANRLESINLYPQNEEVNNQICPLCEQGLSTSIPKIEELKKSLIGLQNNLKLTKKERPRLKEYLDKLHETRTNLTTQVKEVEKSISTIYKEQEQAKKLKNLNIRKGRVLGRISLYLESKIEINNFSQSKQKIKTLESEINNLENKLSVEEKEDKLEGILDQISVQMTTWSQDLELEFKDRTIKFDIKKLTLFIISPERKIRFDQTGSGENWVAYHLLIHFALHKYFVINRRPTPRFLVIDQMSQAYFPPEKDLKKTGEVEQSEDDKAIRRLFDFIFKRTGELEGNFQTIIIDHAKLNNDRFKHAIQEEWRNGEKLVPIDWIKMEKKKKLV